MEKKETSKYRLVGVTLAQQGSYFIEYGDVKNVVPVKYIQFWQDAKGLVFALPLAQDEMTSEIVEEPMFCRDSDDFVNQILKEDRQVETRMTCYDFYLLCSGLDCVGICEFMASLCEYVIKGEVGVTSELYDYIIGGDWGDLHFLGDDGTMDEGWEKTLAEDGSLSNTKNNN